MDAFSWPGFAEATRLVTLTVQLALVLLVIHEFQLESRTFYNVTLLATGGFVIHSLLPLTYRLPFFVLLSFVGVGVVFGLADGGWLVATGLILIGVCHLPLKMSLRVALLLGVGGLLALARGGMVPSPVGQAVWPILGSIFMFRLALYLYSLDHEKNPPRPARTLAYFFMLPNLVFPLFPVIDYSTFSRTHYDEEPVQIYETGMRWIVRGLVQLILYRFVYLSLPAGPLELADVGDLAGFLLGTFLLYLRVSGSFHLIVGMLHLFGFRLPETHRLYFLAPSFTDFWRRINIYWKDFMMKLVYFPSFFRLRRWGNTTALVVATVIVFVVTWLLHSYQWFWLRGGFPVTAQDGLFWGFLGILVVFNALREARRGRTRAAARQGWSLSLALRTLGTFTVICVLWSLWSAESVIGWLMMWRVAARADAMDLMLLGSFLVGSLVVCGFSWRSWGLGEGKAGQQPFYRKPAVQSSAILVGLLVLGQPSLYGEAAPALARNVASLQSSLLSAADAELQHKGYYEKLDNPGRMSAQLWETIGSVPSDWQGPSDIGIIRPQNNFLSWDLSPSLQSSLNGVPITTNRWGMRDRDYSLIKPPGTVRIAILGQSHVLGTFVSDEETFENVLERRLNAAAGEGGPRYEILNFAVTNYSLTQEVALLESRVFAFDPDIVILTVPSRGRERSGVHLLQVTQAGVEIPYPEVRAMVRQAGLDVEATDGIPVPFAWARRAVESLGIATRIPYTEAEVRARDMSWELTAWALHRAASSSLEHGAQPVALALDNVGDPPAQEIPELQEAREAGFLVLNLFDVYQAGNADSLRIVPWDNHPNARGHELIADRLYHEFLEHQERLGLRLSAPAFAHSERN